MLAPRTFVDPTRKPRAEKPRKRLRRVSKKRAVQLRAYSAARAIYLASHPVCEVWLRENNWRIARTGLLGVVWYERATKTGIDFVEVNGTVLIQNWKAPASTEIHHMNKRRGETLLDENFWLAVSRKNHERIENDKAWARRAGFLLNF